MAYIWENPVQSWRYLYCQT